MNEIGVIIIIRPEIYLASSPNTKIRHNSMRYMGRVFQLIVPIFFFLNSFLYHLAEVHFSSLKIKTKRQLHLTNQIETNEKITKGARHKM